MTSTDPRGPHRTIATVESPPDAHVVTYTECGHTGRLTRHHAAPRPGDRDRCHACGRQSAEELPGTSVPGTRGQARIAVRPATDTEPRTYVLYVRFGGPAPKLRDVGYYPTRAAALQALTDRTYGF